MPHWRFDWHERIKAVEREWHAIERLSADGARDPTALGRGTNSRDLKSADENLGGTYLVRMDDRTVCARLCHIFQVSISSLNTPLRESPNSIRKPMF